MSLRALRERHARRLKLVWGGLWLVALGLALQPVSMGILRAGGVAVAVGLWAGALLWWWPRKGVRAALLGGALLPLALLLGPGRPADEAALRSAYLESLRSFEGTRYHWGGESRLGIDCSGLVRHGLIRAALWQGLTTANPALVRDAAELWWFDASAKALGEGYRGFTKDLGTVESLNQMPPERLMPGDVAVTRNGLHTMAYLGDGVWIEADPGELRVLVLRAPSPNPWMGVPMRLVRWARWAPEAPAATSHAR